MTKRVVSGAPDMDKASTSYIERNNGTMRHFIGRMRRLCYAFSKRPENHKAAVALNYVHYNLCHIPRTTRITPAMGVGIAKSPWDLEELLDALLSAEPCDPPHVRPLVHPKPAETARELPSGRGWLRALSGGNGPAPGPAPTPEAPTPTSAAPATSAPVLPPDDRQLSLLDWRPPKPPPKGQLSLFDDL